MNGKARRQWEASRRRCERALALLVLAAQVPSTLSAEETTERLIRMVEERVPGAEVRHLQPSAVPGIYEASIEGEAVYLTADGRYVFTGKLYDLELREDLTEPFLEKIRLSSLAAVPVERMIVFPAIGKLRHTVTTFTDIDCLYCRRLHSHIDEINGYGIEVRYLLFPRAGTDSDSYKKAVSVWCAEDQQAEMTLAKAGVDPEPRRCDNPVRDHIRLAERLGINATPMTVTDTGEKIIGYVAPDQLLKRLEAARQRENQ